MWVFASTFVILVLAALGLAVGTLRGRPPAGSCREACLAGGVLPRCEACPSRAPTAEHRAPHPGD